MPVPAEAEGSGVDAAVGNGIGRLVGIIGQRRRAGHCSLGIFLFTRFVVGFLSCQGFSFELRIKCNKAQICFAYFSSD